MSITKPGYYRLTDDFTPQNIADFHGKHSGISIVTSDVILDGMGHTIDGSNIPDLNGYSVGNVWPSTAISIAGYKLNDWASDIILENMTIRHWYWGISGYHVKDSQFRNMVVTSNSEGIRLGHSSGVLIQDSTILHNNHAGISGDDVEKISIINNTISDNHYAGISLDGALKISSINPFFFTQNVFGRQVLIPSIYIDQKQTSGDAHAILQNSISNNNAHGIWIANSNSNDIVSNTISNASTGITLYNCGPDEDYLNNTFFQNQKNYSRENPDIALSIIIGLVLTFLLKILTGTYNIGKKIYETKIINRILVRFISVENQIRSAVHKSRLSLLLEDPLAITFAGALIFGAAYAFSSSIHLTVLSFMGLLVISGIVTVIPRTVQYYTAQKFGLRAEYRMWWGGIFIIFITMLIPFGTIFGQSIKMELLDETSPDKKELMVTRFAAALTTIFLSLGFVVLYLIRWPVGSLAMAGLQLSLLSSVVLLLPVSPMDGESIRKWNKRAWGVLFFPVLIWYLYLNLVI